MATKTIHLVVKKTYTIRSGYGMNFVCCDCGLTHRIWIQPGGKGWIRFAMQRDNPRTEGRRRARALRKQIRELARRLKG